VLAGINSSPSCNLSLRENGDDLRAEEHRRAGGGSTRFFFDALIWDEDGSFHHFRFVVDDAAAEYGVLRIVYADKIG
jgi:hypothetical protein